MLSSIKLYKHSFIALFSAISRMILGFVSVPLFLSYLGTERYGVWAVCSSFMAFINLLDAGIAPTLKNKLSNAYANGDQEQHTFYFKTGLFFGGVLFIIFIITLIPITLIRWDLIFLLKGNIAIAEIRYLLIVISLVAFSTLIFANIENYYASKLQLAAIKKWDIVLNLLAIIALYISIKLSFSLPTLALIYSSPQILVRLFFFLQIYLKQPKILILRRNEMVKLKHELIVNLHTGSHFLGIQICEAILTALPTFLILRMIGLTAVTQYNVTYKIMSLPLLCIASVLPIIWPSFTVAWAKNEVTWIKINLMKFISLTVLGFVIFLLVMLITNGYLISIWSKGNINVDLSQVSLCWLIAIILAVTYWLSTFLHSVGDFKFEFYSHIIITANLLFFGFLAAKYGGLNSLLLTIALSWLFFGLIPMIIRVRKLLFNKVNL